MTGDRHHQDLSEIELRYQGQVIPNMMSGLLLISITGDQLKAQMSQIFLEIEEKMSFYIYLIISHYL